MVDNPVNDRHRHVVVVEELAPAGEVLVGGQDDGPVFVQAVDQLEQVVPGLPGHGQVAQLIDDQQVVFGQGADPLFQVTLHLGQFKLFHQIQGVAEQHPVAGFHGFVANADGQVGLAYTGRADEHQVVPLVDELEVQQGSDLTFGDGGLVPVGEALQALLSRERGHLPVPADALVLALDQFVFGKPVREAQIGHLVGFSLGQQVGFLAILCIGLGILRSKQTQER